MPPTIRPPLPSWLDTLAGDDPKLRNSAGEPMVTFISSELGLDRSTLGKIIGGDIGMSAAVMHAIARFLAANRGFTQGAAEAWAFARSREVAEDLAGSRAGQAVAA